eukprot:scaffold53025_cov60-Phaeocystis_antarctica.AAC.3
MTITELERGEHRVVRLLTGAQTEHSARHRWHAVAIEELASRRREHDRGTCAQGASGAVSRSKLLVSFPKTKRAKASKAIEKLLVTIEASGRGKACLLKEEAPAAAEPAHTRPWGTETGSKPA